jgi:acetyltransferase-like isoleucine patch superfamily enzyme
LLFFLMLFYPLMKSNLLPVPLIRLLYLGLGARMGENTYSGGILFDPIFIDLGSNTLIGQGAMLIPHVIEGPRLAHHPIHIGSNVTIGANAVILADVRIEDEAIVAIGAVVPKGSRIGRGEVWGGIPARRLRAPESPGNDDQQRA